MLLGLTIRDVVLIDRLEVELPAGLVRADRRDRRRQIDPARRAGPGARHARGERAGAARRRAGGGERRVRARAGPCGARPPRRSRASPRRATRSSCAASSVPTGEAAPSSTTNRQASASCASSARAWSRSKAQFAQRGLLDPATHRTALDAFGGHDAALDAAWACLAQLARVRQGARRCRRRARQGANRGGLSAPCAGRARRARPEAGRRADAWPKSARSS